MLKRVSRLMRKMDLLTAGMATMRGAIAFSLPPIAVTKSLAGAMT